MWLIFALITFFAWGGADIFYKLGTPEEERYSHLKTSVVVGLVMGATALVTLLTKHLTYDFRNLFVYLPVSLMYILSMTIGYFGLRYLQVSVSSPIQNASGAVSAVLLMIVLRELPSPLTLAGIVAITFGVVFLGYCERKQELAFEQQYEKKYKIGFIAFLMPVLYCVIDSLGTFFDGWYLDDPEATPLLGVTEDTIEDIANVSYQLTFFFAAVVLLLYILIRTKQFKFEKPKERFLAAGLETAGQLTYVYALSENGIVAAPVIASYCVASMIFGRIFLKEKLNRGQKIAACLVIAGIVMLGIVEGIEG